MSRGCIAAVLVLVLGVAGCDESTSTGSRSGAGAATLARVVDGDTLELDNGERVRLIGINTPETEHPDFGDECYGHQATRFTEGLLPDGEELRLVFDVERRDQYDRLLAYVYRQRDGLFVNAEVIGSGYAYVETVPPNVEHADEFRALAREARQDERGLWSRCPTSGGQPRNAHGGCLDDYEGACVPPVPPDLDCDDIDGPVTVVGDDPHNLDGNHDGAACESTG